MSEVTEKKRRGRPTKNDSVENKTEFIENNDNQESTMDIAEEKISNNENSSEGDDDLKEFLKQSKKKKSETQDNGYTSSSNDIDDEALNDIEKFESSEGLNDIPDDDFDPLQTSVKERSYTGGMAQPTQNGAVNNDIPQTERIIEEPKYNVNSSSNKLDVDENLINPTNDIPNDIPNNDNSGGGNGGNGGNGGDSSKKSDGEGKSSGGGSEKKEKSEKAGADNVKELSPKEKREAVEKTADAILLAYKSYVPLAFIYFSSYNIKKLEKLHENDEIDLATEVRRDGTTFREYAQEFNQSVEKAFEVTDAEVEALKEPLVDVLMEQEFAFTPTQRLMFVAGQFIVAKVMICIKFLREKKSDMDEMKEIHREKMEAIANQEQRRRTVTPQPQPKAQAVNPEPKNVKVTENPEPNEEEKEEEKESTTNSETISEANIISEEKNTAIIKTPTLDDALEFDIEEEKEEEEDKNDIPE